MLVSMNNAYMESLFSKLQFKFVARIWNSPKYVFKKLIFGFPNKIVAIKNSKASD